MITVATSRYGLSPGSAVEDYLKLIYQLNGEHDHVSLAQVAEGLGVSAPAVTKMVKRLKRRGMADYDRRNGLRLTGNGVKTALDVMRSHRLIELFLQRHLGYSWDEVHEEAEQLEHVISLRFRRKIAELMGDPTRDPHGDPIPGPGGEFEPTTERSLAESPAGFEGVVTRVSNHDSGMLRYLDRLGLRPGARVSLRAAEPFGGPLRLNVDGAERVIGLELARHIFFDEQRD